MKTLLTHFLLISILAMSACGGTDTSKKEEKIQGAEQPADMEEALTKAKDALEKANMKQAVEPVNFRKLQELLPEKVSGYDRQSLSGETTGAMNMKISKAEGKYRDASGKTLNVDIIDTGGFGMAMIGVAAWSTLTIDKEDDKGYERTNTLDGNKCFEKFRKDGSRSELSVLAENRFIVAASARDCSMETLRSMVKGMDLGKLKGLK